MRGMRFFLASIVGLTMLAMPSPARAEREWLACVWDQSRGERQYNSPRFPPQRVWLSFDPDQRQAWISNNRTSWTPAQITRLSPNEVHIRGRSIFDSSQEVEYQYTRRDYSIGNSIHVRAGRLSVNDFVRSQYAGSGECSYY